MERKDIISYLDDLTFKYNSQGFIDKDPISIPHSFSKREDIEISGLWTAVLSWGQRKTIINKARELFKLMDNAPYDFIVNHTEKDRSRFLNFKHRTFQPTDTLYFLEFLQYFYRNHNSLEEAFISDIDDLEASLSHFHDFFFSLDVAPQRTKKHIPSPSRGSTCKRLNMFLRWMVRNDDAGVDFGLWKRISPSSLFIPLDVHVGRVSRQIGLLTRKQNDWKAVIELTEALRTICPQDPVIYDFALFSLGVNQKQIGY